MEMNSIPWSPVLRYATPLPMNRTRFDRSAPTQVRFVCFAVRHTPPDQQDPHFDRRRSVSSVLRYARPLPMNRIPFRTWPVEHKAVSSVLRYARPRFHRLFRPSPPDEHDDAFRSDPAGWLPMNTTTTLFLRSDPAMSTSPRRTYARVGVRDPARMYTYMAVFSFLHPGRCTYVYMLRARLYYDVRASTTTRTRLYIHQYICTYTFATRMTTLRTLRPGGSRQIGRASCRERV